MRTVNLKVLLQESVMKPINIWMNQQKMAVVVLIEKNIIEQ